MSSFAPPPPSAAAPAAAAWQGTNAVFVFVSDTHGLHDRIATVPPGDVLVHCGDFSDRGSEKQIRGVLDWMARQPHKYKLMIAGNHDMTLDPAKVPLPETCRDLMRDALSSHGVHYLLDTAVTLDFGGHGRSLTIWGSPWQPEFCAWGFNLPRGAALAEKWALIPPWPAIDVLLTHGPPQGVLDFVPHSGSFAGCEALLADLHRTRPRLHAFGHIHEGYGVFKSPASISTPAPSSALPPSTLFVNASSCTGLYECTNLPIVCSVPFDKALPAECLSRLPSASPQTALRRP